MRTKETPEGRSVRLLRVGEFAAAVAAGAMTCTDAAQLLARRAQLMDALRTPSIFDRFEAPPSARLLGWTLRAIDPDAGTIEIGFTADDRFTNPGGTVQGGFLAAMLDDTQGPALFGHTHGEA